MHGSPPHPAGSERDEPVPGMISGGAPPPQAPPEMHDPALAPDRTWSPRRETARLAAFRPLAFPGWPAIRPPVLRHLAPGPRPGQTGPASVADQQAAHVMAVAAAPPHHRGQPPVGQARTARHQPSACEGITRRTAGRAWLPDLPRRTFSSPLAGSSAQCAGRSLGSPP